MHSVAREHTHGYAHNGKAETQTIALKNYMCESEHCTTQGLAYHFLHENIHHNNTIIEIYIMDFRA